MTPVEIEWTVTEEITISDHARKLGFDLRLYKNQKGYIQEAIKKITVDSVIAKIRQTWDDDDGNSTRFDAIKRGVYVIAIVGGFGIKYKEKCSEVMYIGRGGVGNRLRSHMQNWIFDMAISLRDIPFKFYMESFPDSRSPELFKYFEGKLLEEFYDIFGEKPLINKIAARRDAGKYDYRGNCYKPFDNRGKKYHWEIRPTPRNEWFKEIEDE